MNTMSSPAPLLSYQPAIVLSRFEKDYPSSRFSANEVWAELMRFFWLCQHHYHARMQHPDDDALNFTCGMKGLIPEMDMMWHTFLLFTQEYAEFCQRYFGRFLHHSPITEKISFQESEVPFRKYLSYIYDHLGEETLKRWYQTMPTG